MEGSVRLDKKEQEKCCVWEGLTLRTFEEWERCLGLAVRDKE